RQTVSDLLSSCTQKMRTRCSQNLPNGISLRPPEKMESALHFMFTTLSKTWAQFSMCSKKIWICSCALRSRHDTARRPFRETCTRAPASSRIARKNFPGRRVREPGSTGGCPSHLKFSRHGALVPRAILHAAPYSHGRFALECAARNRPLHSRTRRRSRAGRKHHARLEHHRRGTAARTRSPRPAL